VSGVVLRPAGDRAMLLEVSGVGAAARVAESLRAECPQLVDVVPGHCTVLATWDDEAPGDLEAIAIRVLAGGAPARSPATVSIPVTYDGADLALVAELVGLSIDEVVARHTGAAYTVGFLGFAPGFAYLVGGDGHLQVPRRDEPRTHVPGGSVALAGPYRGIDPREGPGGWQLIGRTTFVPFDPDRASPAALAAGDNVRFSAE
jgi:KipI family sensor histidine kinase inhibitor